MDRRAFLQNSAHALVLGALPASVTSIAVSVQLPAVMNVTWKVCIPPLKAAFAGSTAFTSVLVITTVSVTAGATLKAGPTE